MDQKIANRKGERITTYSHKVIERGRIEPIIVGQKGDRVMHQTEHKKRLVIPLLVVFTQERPITGLAVLQQATISALGNSESIGLDGEVYGRLYITRVAFKVRKTIPSQSKAIIPNHSNILG